jgi:hypothetical protein
MFMNNKNFIFYTTFRNVKNKNYPPTIDKGSKEAITAVPTEVPILVYIFSSSSVG